jgi:hypothetical protein
MPHKAALLGRYVEPEARNVRGSIVAAAPGLFAILEKILASTAYVEWQRYTLVRTPSLRAATVSSWLTPVNTRRRTFG